MSTAVLVLITLVWAFAAVGFDSVLELIALIWACAAVGQLVWLGSYSEYSRTCTRHTCTGVASVGRSPLESVTFEK